MQNRTVFIDHSAKFLGQPGRMQVPIKITLEGVTRRISIDKDMPLMDLDDKIAYIFGLKDFDDKDLHLTYIDDEGDDIPIESDEELLEAMRLIPKMKREVLRIQAELIETEEPLDEDEDRLNEPQIIEEEFYELAVKELLDMGFVQDPESVRATLIAYKGDVNAAAFALMHQKENQRTINSLFDGADEEDDSEDSSQSDSDSDSNDCDEVEIAAHVSSDQSDDEDEDEDEEKEKEKEKEKEEDKEEAEQKVEERQPIEETPLVEAAHIRDDDIVLI